jgi:hypothetical protein
LANVIRHYAIRFDLYQSQFVFGQVYSLCLREEIAIMGDPFLNYFRARSTCTAMLAIALVIGPATASDDTSYCGQAPELAAARLRWAEVRKRRVHPIHSDKHCLSYGIYFYEAVTARLAASVCTDGIDRQRNLKLLDSEIDAFNSLIATQCGG